MTTLHRAFSWATALTFLAAVTASATPRLVVTPTTLGPIFVPTGSNGATQTLEAYNAGDGTLVVSATTSSSWLTATIGATRPCTSQITVPCFPISVALNTSALASGTYTAAVIVSAANTFDTQIRASVTINVGNVPSSIRLNTPTSGSAFTNIYPRVAVNASVATASGGQWLSVLAPGGNFIFGSPYKVTVTPSGLPAGVYTGTVTLTGVSNPADIQTIPVTMVATDSPILQTDPKPNFQISGVAGGAKVTASLGLFNLGNGTLTVTSATPDTKSAAFLSASVAPGNVVQLTADPAQLTSGMYTGTLALASNAINNADTSILVEFNVLPSGQPTISLGGIVNIATFTGEAAAQGDILAVFGEGFTAPGTLYTNPGPPPLAKKLGDVQVLANGIPAPLFFVSPQQINFQMPYDLAAGQSAAIQVVSGGTAGNSRTILVSKLVPHVLLWPAGVAFGYPIVVNASDGTLSLPTTAGYGVYASRPSKPGETLVVYCTGLGQTTPVVVAGEAAYSTPLPKIAPLVKVTFGSPNATTSATPSYSGLVPTAVGLYQVNVTLPANVATGTKVPMTILVDDIPSNSVNIAIAGN